MEQIRRALPEANQGAYNTVQTVLNRLADRGLLERRREGHVIVYAPALSEADYLSRSIEHTMRSATPRLARSRSRSSSAACHRRGRRPRRPLTRWPRSACDDARGARRRVAPGHRSSARPPAPTRDPAAALRLSGARGWACARCWSRAPSAGALLLLHPGQLLTAIAQWPCAPKPPRGRPRRRDRRRPGALRSRCSTRWPGSAQASRWRCAGSCAPARPGPGRPA